MVRGACATCGQQAELQPSGNDYRCAKCVKKESKTAARKKATEGAASEGAKDASE